MKNHILRPKTNVFIYFSMGIVEVIVSRDGILSISNGLYTKKVIQSGQTSTVSMISSAIIPKWTKLQVMIKSDINVYIEEGSTLSLVHLGKYFFYFFHCGKFF